MVWMTVVWFLFNSVDYAYLFVGYVCLSIICLFDVVLLVCC